MATLYPDLGRLSRPALNRPRAAPIAAGAQNEPLMIGVNARLVVPSGSCSDPIQHRFDQAPGVGNVGLQRRGRFSWVLLPSYLGD